MKSSRHKQNNDDAMALLKGEIEYLKGNSWRKKRQFPILLDFVKVHLALYKITHHHRYR